MECADESATDDDVTSLIWHLRLRLATYRVTYINKFSNLGFVHGFDKFVIVCKSYRAYDMTRRRPEGKPKQYYFFSS